MSTVSLAAREEWSDQGRWYCPGDPALDLLTTRFRQIAKELMRREAMKIGSFIPKPDGGLIFKMQAFIGVWK